MSAAIIQELRDKGIPVLGLEATDPEERSEYERSVATANLLYRFSRPECVVQPTRVEHIQDLIKITNGRQITIVIKNGGHSYSGASTAPRGTISLDLIKFNNAILDMNATPKTVTVDGGCRWG